MTRELSFDRPDLLASLDKLLDDYSPWRLIAALPVVLVQRSRRNRALNQLHLDEHLCRDMGLPPPKVEKIQTAYDLLRVRY